MDALALLCNLHADGPATLQRLRRAGCESLTALGDLTLSDLARELKADEEAAMRFQREAELLEGRMNGEEEEAEAVTADTQGTLDPGDPEDSDSFDERSVATALPDRDPMGRASADPEVDRVLATWRSLDRDAPPLPPGEFLVPRPVASPVGNRAIEEIGLEGLTAEIAETLAQAGVLSLRGLCEAVTLDLAGELGLPFTRVRRLQFLARRAMEEFDNGAGVDSASTVTPAAPAAPANKGGPAGIDRLDTAGPFA